jgi:hypothetical protein
MTEEPQRDRPAAPRAAWQPPAVTALGNVKELIRGGPKTGGGDDADHGMRKDPAIG